MEDVVNDLLYVVHPHETVDPGGLLLGQAPTGAVLAHRAVLGHALHNKHFMQKISEKT